MSKLIQEDVEKWIYKVIEGPTGFKAWEDSGVIFHNSRDACIAKFVIDALANPSCEGSNDILRVINGFREKKIYQLNTQKEMMIYLSISIKPTKIKHYKYEIHWVFRINETILFASTIKEGK